MRYLKQNWIAFDQQINALIGGWADETISARASRRSASSKFWKTTETIIDGLFFFEDLYLKHKYKLWPSSKHCKRAYAAERRREQLPPEYR